MKNIKYIQFFMKFSISNPRVKYITELQENSDPLSLPYDKFKKFLFENFYIKDKEGLLRALDEHSIVFLNNETGEHTIRDLYKEAFEADFKTLFNLNSNKNNESVLQTNQKIIKNSLDSLFKKINDGKQFRF